MSHCAARAPFTARELRQVLDYDPETGVFMRLRHPKTRRAGRAAGCLKRDGYVVIKVHGRSCLAHRLAWLHVTGRWPSRDIDHKDNDKSNNRFANLREADDSQNKANSRAYRRSSSGLKGAAKHGSGKWQAMIVVHRRPHYLGLFDTPEAAHEAYCAAAKKFFGEFARAA